MVRIGQLRATAMRARSRNVPDTSDTQAAAVISDALETCETLLQDLAGAQLQVERTQAELRAEMGAHQDLLRRMPIACVTTDADGTIVEANESAAMLLKVSIRRLNGRQFADFIQDHDAFVKVSRCALVETAVTAALVVRPRDSAPREVEVTILPARQQSPSEWLWFLTPTTRAAMQRPFRPGASPDDGGGPRREGGDGA